MFNPIFNINNNILQNIANIEKQYEELKKVALPSAFINHLKLQCHIALTHFSNQIEGNQLTLLEVSSVIEKGEHFGSKRDEQEVKNYFDLISKLKALKTKYKNKLNTKLILQAHKSIQNKIVTGDLIGKLRAVQNAVYSKKKIVYLPPEPQDVPALITELCQWIENSNTHPIITAGVFHNQFVTIHPFVDGNGRSARALSIYLLMKQGWDFRELVPVDRYYANNRKKYYQLLQQSYSHNYYFGRNKTDFTAWLEYYTEGINQTLTETLSELKRFSDKGILLNNRQQNILKWLKKHSSITPKDYAKKFTISTRMASRDLKQLLEWNYIKQIGSGRSTKYYL